MGLQILVKISKLSNRETEIGTELATLGERKWARDGGSKLNPHPSMLSIDREYLLNQIPPTDPGQTRLHLLFCGIIGSVPLCFQQYAGWELMIWPQI